MEVPQDQTLPTLSADVKNLQRALEDLYRSEKSTGGQRHDQPATSSAGGIVIKGK
jgi:hypothetical protein